MSIFAKLRKGVSDLRAQVQGVHAEIERLETERATLMEAPIRFDCWIAAMVRAIDIQADQAPKKILKYWELALRDSVKERGRSILSSPVKQYEDKSLLETGVFERRTHERLGVGFDVVLSLCREPMKKLFLETLEPLRAEWPRDGQCGPPLEKRLTRIAEIDTQLETLRAERDEAASVLEEIAKPAAQREGL